MATTDEILGQTWEAVAGPGGSVTITARTDMNWGTSESSTPLSSAVIGHGLKAGTEKSFELAGTEYLQLRSRRPDGSYSRDAENPL